LRLIIVCHVVTGSCRPSLRSVVRRHVYELGEFGVRRELLFMFQQFVVILSYVMY